MSDATLEVSHRHYLYIGAGAIGLVSTVLFTDPGVYTAKAGPVRFDAYYAAAYGFFFIVVFSLYYSYAHDVE